MKHKILVAIFLTFFILTNTFSKTLHIKNSPEKKELTKNPIVPISTKKHLLEKNYSPLKFQEKNWHLELKLNQHGNIWDSKLENSFRYRLYVNPNFLLKMSDYFFFSASLNIGDTIGSVQSRFGDLRADNFIYLRNAKVYFQKQIQTNVNDYLYIFSLGAIDQRKFLKKFDLLMSSRALPGLEQGFKYSYNYTEKKSFGIDLRFFQGIPTSQSDSLDFNEKESIPFFVNGGFKVFIKNLNLKPFMYKVGLSFGVFDFSTLPAVIADESRRLGNTVNGVGGAADFEYDFKGWYGGWTTILSFNKFEIFPYVKIVTNTQAPRGKNQGQRAGVHFRYHSQSLYSLDIEPFSFFNEADASVASYNGSTYGHNNREGFGINLALELPKQNLKFGLIYVYSDILRENSDLQIPYQFMGFKMEYKHDF